MKLCCQQLMLLCLIGSGLGGCSSFQKMPRRQMIFASAAMRGADRAQAERRSPDLFRRAENAYWKANRAYFARDYETAARAANEARRFAELAEKDAEIKAALSGAGDE